MGLLWKSSTLVLVMSILSWWKNFVEVSWTTLSITLSTKICLLYMVALSSRIKITRLSWRSRRSYPLVSWKLQLISPLLAHKNYISKERICSSYTVKWITFNLSSSTLSPMSGFTKQPGKINIEQRWLPLTAKSLTSITEQSTGDLWCWRTTMVSEGITSEKTVSCLLASISSSWRRKLSLGFLISERPINILIVTVSLARVLLLTFLSSSLPKSSKTTSTGNWSIEERNLKPPSRWNKSKMLKEKRIPKLKVKL